MKRTTKILCFILVISVVSLLVACSDTDKSEEVSSQPKTTYFDGVSTINLEKNAVLSSVKEGKITLVMSLFGNVDVSIGDTTEKIFGNSKMNFKDHENEKFIYYDNGQARIFFKNDEDTKGCIAISTMSTAYNFEPGIMNRSDVLNIMGEADIEGETPKDLLDMVFGEMGTYCAYRSGDNTISFFFSPTERLVCIILSQNSNWIY